MRSTTAKRLSPITDQARVCLRFIPNVISQAQRNQCGWSSLESALKITHAILQLSTAISRPSSQLGFWESERRFEDCALLLSHALGETEALEVLRSKLANGTS